MRVGVGFARHGCALAMVLAALAPAQNGRKLTTPKEALGFEIGDDYYLANYTKLTAWSFTWGRRSRRSTAESSS